jgi:hypothetical protein
MPLRRQFAISQFISGDVAKMEKARVCKTLITGSSPVVASLKKKAAHP